MVEAEAEAGEAEREANEAEPTEARGLLLDCSDETCAKAVARLWSSTDGPHEKRYPQWALNRLSRRGVRGARVDSSRSARDDNEGVWVPPGAMDMPPSPNNVDQLMRRIVDTVTADAPRMEANPQSADDDDIAAALTATRLLDQEDSEAGANLRQLTQSALNLAGTYASSFSYQYVDPYGLREALEVRAHRNATDAENPLIDPTTGEAVQQESDLVTRYVKTVNGVRMLVQGTVGAEHVWKPVIREELLRPHCVRLLPANCTGIADATGVMLGRVSTLGAAKSLFEKVGEMDGKAQRELCRWRPSSGARYWVQAAIVDAMEESADAMKRPMGERDEMKTGESADLPDETPVYLRCLYYLPSREYPRGAYVCIGADSQLLGRGEWSAQVGEGDEAREETYMLPVSQMRVFADPVDSDAYGITPVQWMAPIDEIVSQLLLSWQEFLYRFNSPNVYLPIGSPIQPQALAIRDGTPIRYDMATGKPEYEVIPSWPGEASALLDRFEGWIHTLSGLEDAARGVASASVKSGIHAERIIEQALVALTQVVSNVADFLTRRSRIRLQLIATNYTAPRMLRYQTENGSARVKAFRGADLRGVRDVRLARSSLTMLTRMAKVSLIREELQVALNAGDQTAYLRYRAAMADSLDPLMAIEDDPHLLRVKRQVSTWRDGPEDGTDPAQLWAPVPADELPDVAATRAYVLARAIAGERYQALKSVEGWNQGLDEALAMARQAAGILTVAEQQEQARQNAPQPKPSPDEVEASRTEGKSRLQAEKAQLDSQLSAQESAQRAEEKAKAEMVKAAMGVPTDPYEDGIA